MIAILNHLKIILFGILILSIFGCGQEKQPPNIIFIMADDHSVGATGAYGNSLVPTPNIDKLAGQGMRFNNCFNVVSLCGPSRASILSGRYSVHNGYMRNGDQFDRSQVSFPKLLQQSGYETAVIGKWHLVTEPAGFDYYNVIPYQGQYFDCRMKEIGQEWEDGNKGGIVQPGYLTEVITDKAIGWLNNRDVNKPFCLLVHHKAPHGPHQYPERYEKLFADQPLPEPETFNDTFEGRNDGLLNGVCGFSKLINVRPNHFNQEVPDSIKFGTQEYKEWAYQCIFKGHFRLIAALDENIGRFMDYIDESGLGKNTIVVYTSDNGWFVGDHGLFNKMWMYDESLRVPLIIRYPEKVKPGSVSDDFVSVLDFAPTFLDYAGIEKNSQFQGHSIKPLLSSDKPGDWPASHFYHYFGQFEVPAHYGVRTKDFKLIHFYEAEKGPEWELYDLHTDPEEMVNLYDNPDYSDELSQMKELLMEQKQKYEETEL